MGHLLSHPWAEIEGVRTAVRPTRIDIATIGCNHNFPENKRAVHLSETKICYCVCRIRFTAYIVLPHILDVVPGHRLGRVRCSIHEPSIKRGSAKISVINTLRTITFSGSKSLSKKAFRFWGLFFRVRPN